MNIHPAKPIFFIMGAALVAIAATELTRQSFAQQTQAPIQNATVAESQANQTVFVNEGNTTTLTLNSTRIPLQTTTIEIVTVTKSVDNRLISELQNMTVTAGSTEAPSFDLSRVQNQTVTSATGQAVSTIVSRTDIPYNVTTLQFTSTTGQNQTFDLILTTSPEQVIEQLFETPQQIPGNQTNNISAAR
jgi:hypothetical protein